MAAAGLLIFVDVSRDFKVWMDKVNGDTLLWIETGGNYPGNSSGWKPTVTEAAQVFETKEVPESTGASASAGGMDIVPIKGAEAPQAPESRGEYKTWYYAEAIDCELDPS
ncbi:unnamed protein product, partial [Polarella glacialis]